MTLLAICRGRLFGDNTPDLRRRPAGRVGEDLPAANIQDPLNDNAFAGTTDTNLVYISCDATQRGLN